MPASTPHAHVSKDNGIAKAINNVVPACRHDSEARAIDDSLVNRPAADRPPGSFEKTRGKTNLVTLQAVLDMRGTCWTAP
ncbi:hypothetical protein [Bradyrhizobium sp.]|uniref:hypothetical protein n=1 Tax=Bradyrhizobium sp. TaxID=376 RepID=UPI0026270EA0|nr:hypothetical protein [Bradyrhizobium sp.]